MKATVNHPKKKKKNPKCLILGVQCGVGSSPQRSGSLHSRSLIGSHSANSILENSCLKTQPFLVVVRRYLEIKTNKNTARHSTHTYSARKGGVLYYFFTPPQQQAPRRFLSDSACCVFVRPPGKLNWGSMVLNFHCNKWIRGGDPTKVSGGLFY